MPAAELQAIDGARADKLLVSLKRTQTTIICAYLFDSLVLVGFYCAGFVSFWAPLAVFTALGLLAAAVRWAHASRWSLKRRDPTLFLPQQLYTIAVALSVAIAAPAIGFQPFATLFAISAFSFMAPNPKTLVVCWVAASIGALAVIFIDGPRLAMPTSSLAGQALTGMVVIGLLARCISVAMSFRTLQHRLAQKNEDLHKAMERIEALANRDDLTGLPNRRSITNWLEQQMAISARTGLALSVACLDLDHFKRINDTYGHLAGDRALQLFAEQALGAIRATDRLGRHGGEEFLVVMVATDLNGVHDPLERIRQSIAAFDWSAVAEDLRLTITVGATQYSPGESLEQLMKRADFALYLGKTEGRDRIVLDRTPMTDPKVSRPVRAA